jgi:hypothetical protein
MLFQTIYVAAGGIALCLLRTADEREYAGIDAKDEVVALDIERASDEEIVEEEDGEGEEE